MKLIVEGNMNPSFLSARTICIFTVRFGCEPQFNANRKTYQSNICCYLIFEVERVHECIADEMA